MTKLVYVPNNVRMNYKMILKSRERVIKEYYKQVHLLADKR